MKTSTINYKAFLASTATKDDLPVSRKELESLGYDYQDIINQQENEIQTEYIPGQSGYTSALDDQLEFLDYQKLKD